MIHLVVPCSARKRHAPVVRFRDLDSTASLEERFRSWSRALSIHPWSLKDRRVWEPEKLYTGPTWYAANRLEAAVEARGVMCKRWVVSAGYGLCHVEDRAMQPYGATFSSGQQDSIGTAAECRRWWSMLRADPIQEDMCLEAGVEGLLELAGAEGEGPFLMVLSSSYVAAMRDDLEAAVKHAYPGQLLIVTSESAPTLSPALEALTVRTNQRLMKRLKVNNTLLNHAAAQFIVQQLGDIENEHLDADAARALLS